MVTLPGDSLQRSSYRINPFPMSVRGIYRKYRTISQMIFILVFLGIPWIKIQGIQAVLLDLPARRFTFFGLSFWGHDTPIIFFVLAIFSLGITFVTSVWGRVWCGWACPQTVLIDGVFRKIETFIEGNYIARRKLREAPFDRGKILKKAAKWFLFFLISSLLCHTFLAYFVGAENLVRMTVSSPAENGLAFFIVSTTTILFLLNFCWFREQICITICPYGRLQSVLMDDSSLVVVYDEKRGEPRRGSVPKTEKTGDCINCLKCVVSCPTGIDVRRGVQMECISCTACIDACDEVMRITKKPRGLIRYDSENGLAGKPSEFWRMRTYVYLGFITLSCIGLLFGVVNRPALDITLVRAQESPYQVLNATSDTVMITNHYKIYLKNQSADTMEIDINQTEDMRINQIEIIKPAFPATILPGKALQNHVFLKFPTAILGRDGQKKIRIQIVTRAEVKTKKYMEGINLVGPVN